MKAIHHLQLRSNCLYLGGEGNNAEKLSGGFTITRSFRSSPGNISGINILQLPIY